MAIKRETGGATYVLSFAGSGNCGIAYYVSKVFARAGFPTLVIDNSFEQDMFDLVKKPEGADEAEARNILFVHDKEWSTEAFKEVSFVVFWHGMNLDHEIMENSDLNVILSDYNRSHVRELSERLNGLDKKVHLVLVERCTGKIPDKIIAEDLGIGVEDVFEEIGHQTIEMDQNNSVSFQSLQYNGTQKLKTFTASYRDVVTDIAGHFLKDKVGDIKKLVGTVE